MPVSFIGRSRPIAVSRFDQSRTIVRLWRRRGDLPQQRSARGGEARRSGRFSEVSEDLAHGARLGDERDDPHFGVTERTSQREDEIRGEAHFQTAQFTRLPGRR